MSGHGERKHYLLVNDDNHDGEPLEKFYCDSSSSHERNIPLALSREEFMALDNVDANVDAQFRFGWMFERDKADMVKDEEVGKKAQAPLIKLGQLMNKRPQSSGTNSDKVSKDDSEIPSGYTYFGQFLAHEITFDGIPFASGTMVGDLQSVPQQRSPSIDCDSLYGGGPDKNPELYKEESDHSRVRLQLNETVQSPLWGGKLMRDLPRQGEMSPTPRAALIGDKRNDENLPLAQLHVAFILFHNKVVDELSGQYAGRELFEKACEQVVRHLQWIVLDDYLPRIIDENVLNQVLAFAREHEGKLEYFDTEKTGMFMPVEFSVAAFRLGHSMIRKSYEWNFFHKTEPNSGPATLVDFFVFTGFCGHLGGKPNLMGEWIVDWRRFFDFSEIGEDTHGLSINRAKKIDTKFDFHLDELSGYPFNEKDKELRPITVRNLRRGFFLRLPTGQAVADRLNLAADKRLTPEKIAESPDAEITQLLTESGLDKNTPLWYYILREAEHFNRGLKLGPVGSRIVAETFVGILWHSKHSILKNGGPPVPMFGPRKAERKFDMVDMLKFTDNIFAMDDPLKQSNG